LALHVILGEGPGVGELVGFSVELAVKLGWAITFIPERKTKKSSLHSDESFLDVDFLLSTESAL
jgi:hypothetical protein